MPFFSRAGIRVSAIGDRREDLLTVDTEGSTFTLPEPGIYSLEGDNQSGKSLLIKALMSISVRGLDIMPGEGFVEVDGNKAVVKDLPTAIRAGIVAVFQDDHLIPSMTVEEQILLRHATPGWATAYSWIYEALHAGIAVEALEEVDPAFQHVLARLKPREQWLHPSNAVRGAGADLLNRFGFEDNLQKLPAEMSGGARAAARLVQAQLTARIKVLLLDEAFAGVDEHTLPGLVNVVRDWQMKNNTAVLVVTHNASERQLWNPRQGFVVRNRKVTATGTARHKSIHSGLPARHGEFPVYEVAPKESLATYLPSRLGASVVVVDRAVIRAAPTLELIAKCRELTKTALVLELDGGEATKSLETYQQLILEICSKTTPPRDVTFFIVGGGVCLNVGGFVAATLNRGSFPTFLVPTTVMAIADVAIGSKTGVNFHVQGQPLKHTVGAYSNPAGVIVDRRYLDLLTPAERLRGLAECLKHGFLQDRELFDQVAGLLEAGAENVDAVYAAAIRTMDLKSRILRRDPWELGIGRLLMYGHLHAHSFERASDLKLPHGESVYLGLLVEAFLAGGSGVFDALTQCILPAARELSLVIPWTSAQLKAAYGADNYTSYDRHMAIEVPQIGHYREPLSDQPRMRQADWNRIRGAIETVKGCLGQ